ncbi:MAG: TonB-dependent receptor [Acidobacteriota bacterium]
MIKLSNIMIETAVSILLVISSLALPTSAQIQIGTVRGTVLDAADAIIANAKVSLDNSITGYSRRVATDERGQFDFNNIPFANYLLRVEAAGFRISVQDVNVRSNVPIVLSIRMTAAGTSEQVTVESRGSLIEKDSSNTQTRIDERLIRRRPSAIVSRGLQDLIATTPGWMTENNGLLHIRGIDDGILYVVDGVPSSDRVDAVSATALDAEMIQSLNIITGNIPAEFGGRTGAVVLVQPRSGLDSPLTGNLQAGAGNFQAQEIAWNVGGSAGNRLGFFILNSFDRSNRYLDPVDPRNFHNRGGAAHLAARFDWHPTSRDILLFDFSISGSDFRVPNDLDQETSGQHQRQELRDDSQSVAWQRAWSATTVSNLAWFRRHYESRLFGSEFDTPLFASQDRGHTRQGIIASLTRVFRGHTFKAGIEAARVAPREFFTFAVTDEESAERHEISEAAMKFNPTNPFIFSDRRVRGQVSWYAQDVFSPARNFTVSVGLRYDHTKLLTSDDQYSPRVGAVYHIPKTRTALRASFNRLYQPPQVENLLLADSQQARRLSPFAEQGGGAQIRPEKISAYEVGFSQDVSGIFRLDCAWWHRDFRNFDDPNVFFNTTIIFPNSVARGFARGVDVRVDVPERKGWSGYLSYTNQRIQQTGPINSGLFLTDEFIEIGSGTRFIPDHDQRNVGEFGVIYYNKKSGWRASLSGRHESGVPLEVDEERLDELRSASGSDLVDFDRGRVKPWTVLDFSTGIELLREEKATLEIQFDVQNIAGRRFAYNFGNPFEGTHFGHPRLWAGRIRLAFK